MSTPDPLLSILPSHSPQQETTASVFDLLLIDRFSTVFKPGFDYFFTHYLVPHFPIMNLFQGYREEFWCLFAASVQDYYLRSGTSFAPTTTESSATATTRYIGGSLLEESLYGWRRKYLHVRSNPSSSFSSSTTTTQSFSSRFFPSSVSTRIGITVFLQVILPYLRIRAKEWSVHRQELYRRETEQRRNTTNNSVEENTTAASSPYRRSSSSPSSSSPSSPSLSFLDYLARYYPYLHTGYDVVNILFLVRYSLGLSSFSNLNNYINQVQLVRGGTNTGTTSSSSSSVVITKTDVPSFWSVLKRTVQVSIVLTLIILQLYYWWRINQRNRSNNNNNNGTNPATAHWKMVPPPPLPPNDPSMVVAPPAPTSSSSRRTGTDPGDRPGTIITVPPTLLPPSGCPICLRTNPDIPVVLPNGIVYCEACVPDTVVETQGYKKIRVREA